MQTRYRTRLAACLIVVAIFGHDDCSILRLQLSRMTGKGFPPMPYLLNFLYVALLCLFAPVLCWKGWRNGKYREGWGEKFLGKAPRRIGNRPCVWFHAVSVGEVLLLKPILAEMARRRPGWD